MASVLAPSAAVNPSRGIDITTEALIPILEVPKHLPQVNGQPAITKSAVHRWCTRGVRGTRLEYVSIGGLRFTSEAALSRFLKALNQG